MPLKIERDQYVITARVNRPDARNAINFALMARLENLLDELESNPGARLFILTGSGNSFISGGDLREFHQLKKADEAKQMTKRMIRILERIEQLPFWTLAAINGHAYGGGWEVAAYFDFRVAADHASIGFTQGKFYLPPGWGGVSRLAELTGEKTALYWLASQKVVRANRAREASYLHEVFEADTFERNLKQLSLRLTLNDRPFIEYLKQSPSLKDTSLEIEPFSKFWESEEHQKRVDAFLNRKK
jgi:enoyl-CoA hydratase